MKFHASINLICLLVALVLTWTDNSTIEEGFAIERLGETWEEIGRVTKDVTTYTDPTPAEGCYRVRAFTQGAFSLYSNTGCFIKAPAALNVSQ